MFDTLILMLDSTIRVATPLIFASLAGLFSERSGVVNIGLEGNLLVGAFAGAATASVTGSAWIGVLVAVLFSIATSMLHGFATITHRGLIAGIRWSVVWL